MTRVGKAINAIFVKELQGFVTVAYKHDGIALRARDCEDASFLELCDRLVGSSFPEMTNESVGNAFIVDVLGDSIDVDTHKKPP
jgi:hypothetical protein